MTTEEDINRMTTEESMTKGDRGVVLIREIKESRDHSLSIMLVREFLLREAMVVDSEDHNSIMAQQERTATIKDLNNSPIKKDSKDPSSVVEDLMLKEAEIKEMVALDNSNIPTEDSTTTNTHTSNMIIRMEEDHKDTKVTTEVDSSRTESATTIKEVVSSKERTLAATSMESLVVETASEMVETTLEVRDSTMVMVVKGIIFRAIITR